MNVVPGMTHFQNATGILASPKHARTLWHQMIRDHVGHICDGRGTDGTGARSIVIDAISAIIVNVNVKIKIKVVDLVLLSMLALLMLLMLLSRQLIRHGEFYLRRRDSSGKLVKIGREIK